jgi:cation diffusion facilitator CzcD-associated flavoprotein CzcO
MKHLHVAIIGAGFAGVGMAIRLLQTGETSFLVFEREAGVGGTWRINTYPGCACDVQSHVYSFSFAPNPNWSRMFAPQEEIRHYIERCCDQFGVRPYLRLHDAIAEARWHEQERRWHMKTEQGAHYTADILVSATGGLSRPMLPDVPGLKNFAGKTFHSQAWDHSYSLEGKRVAVIGTGASAIQFVPQIQRQVARLDLYQRTPPWILPKPDRTIRASEQRTFARLPKVQEILRTAIYGRLEARALLFVKTPKAMWLTAALAKWHLKNQVHSAALRAKLTPSYTIGCKRILISDDYYPALGQANVDLITDAIAEVKENSVITKDGTPREVDAIILGTGFRATDPIPRGLVFGVGGQDIVDAWRDGPEAYKGTTVHGFPNLFILVGPNTGLGHNSMLYMIESQLAYVLGALAYRRRTGVLALNVRAEAQERYNANLAKKAQAAIWSVGGCRSWYLHPKTGRNVTLWPDYTWVFRRETARFDDEQYQKA